MTRCVIFFISILPVLFSIYACGPAALGGAGYTGYTTATDERSVGTMVDDSVISTTIKTRLFKDEFVNSRHIDVDVLNGRVFLIGVVKTASQKRMAADIARGVDGVRTVTNQLVVGKISAGQILDDTVLSSKIKAELIKAEGVKSQNVDVDVNKGVVTLTGIVSSAAEKNKILYITQKLAGNRGIVDNLSISP